MTLFKDHFFQPRLFIIFPFCTCPFCNTMLFTATNNPRLCYLWMLNEYWCLSDKESACSAEDLGSIPGSRIFPWRREWLPTPVFAWRISWRSLAGYSPWGCKELDTTEWLTHTWEYLTHSSQALSQAFWIWNSKGEALKCILTRLPGETGTP